MLLSKDYGILEAFGGLDSEGNRCDYESMYGIMRDMMSNRPVATNAPETLHLAFGSD